MPVPLRHTASPQPTIPAKTTLRNVSGPRAAILRLCVLAAIVLVTLPFWLPLQAVLTRVNIFSLLVYLLFALTAIPGLRGMPTWRSKGTTLVFGIVGTYFLADRLPALTGGHPFGVAVTAYLTVFVVFGYLALFWWVAYRFVLKAPPRCSSDAGLLSQELGGKGGNQ